MLPNLKLRTFQFQFLCADGWSPRLQGRDLAAGSLVRVHSGGKGERLRDHDFPRPCAHTQDQETRPRSLGPSGYETHDTSHELKSALLPPPPFRPAGPLPPFVQLAVPSAWAVRALRPAPGILRHPPESAVLCLPSTDGVSSHPWEPPRPGLGRSGPGRAQLPPGAIPAQSSQRRTA